MMYYCVSWVIFVGVVSGELQFRTDEVQRCVDAQPGKCFEVQATVATTATYGDKFRVVCRHR